MILTSVKQFLRGLRDKRLTLLFYKRLIARGGRSEAWDQETMFSQLAKRSSQNVDSGVRNNKYSDRRSTYLK